MWRTDQQKEEILNEGQRQIERKEKEEMLQHSLKSPLR